MADILTSKIQVPSLPDDTLILKDAEARQDLSTALATATGNPLNFSTRSSQKANETVISLAPIQDLHGYDYPWSAGGGKNKLQVTATSQTVNGVTFTVNDDGTVLINGTATATTFFGFVQSIPSGSYILSGCPTGGGSSNYRAYIGSGTGTILENIIDTGNGCSFTLTEDLPSNMGYYIRIANGYTATNLLFQPMIRLATETDATFAPYFNYCPIDGRTETSLVGCGKNLVNVDDVSELTIPATGNTRYGIILPKIHGTITFKGINSTDNTTNIAYDIYLNNVRQSREWIVDNGVGSTKTVQIADGEIVYLYNSNSTSTAENTKSIFAACQIQAEIASSPTAYEPFVQSNNLTIQFGEKVYGAKVELEKGTVTVDREIVDMGTLEWTISGGALVCRAPISDKKDGASILVSSSYKYEPNKAFSTGIGEISDSTSSSYIKNIFVKDSRVTSETTASQFASMVSGQQVCYPLATPRTIQLTPNKISLLEGVNVISTDGDGIKLTYRDGKVATLADLQDTANNLQEQIDQNETMKDETTQLLYKLGVNNGLLFMEEV